jgi:hypothetical protein
MQAPTQRSNHSSLAFSKTVKTYRKKSAGCKKKLFRFSRQFLRESFSPSNLSAVVTWYTKEHTIFKSLVKRKPISEFNQNLRIYRQTYENFPTSNLMKIYRFPSYSTQPHAVAYPGIFFRGGGGERVQQIKLRTEDRERGSGGGSLLVRGSEGSCNLVQEISFHIVNFS